MMKASLRAAAPGALATLALLLCAASPAGADETTLPLAAQRLPASAEECVVWRRERGFAQSVEVHDATAFASFLQTGAVFNAGQLEADRGREQVTKSWTPLIEGKSIVLRWRPGIVNIGSDPRVAFSRGPYILQTTKDGRLIFGVGLFQTVWDRDADGAWRVLFDGGASTLTRVDDRAAADAWVKAQAMSDCASGPAP
jgi:ketosteroid isomerase-like protein